MLLDPLSKIKGIGQTIEQHLASLVGDSKIFNLLLHKPSKIEQIAFQPRLFEVENDQLIIIKARVEAHHKPTKPKNPYKVTCYTPTGFFNLVFFKIFPNQIKQMPIGEEIVIMGNLQKKSGENQITHPEAIIPLSEIDNLPKIKLTYPLKYPLTNKLVSNKIRQILSEISQKTKEIDDQKYEWIHKNLKKQQNWPNFLEALKAIHFFEIEKYFSQATSFDANLRQKIGDAQSRFSDKMNNNFDNLSFYRDSSSNYYSYLVEKANQRLAYDELLAWQLAFILAKQHKNNFKEKPKLSKDLQIEFLKNLKFELTSSQQQAIKEISSEILSNKKMLRLLQGDVGSGKTLVAIASCLQAISTQKQCCVLCPTTVLAKQHFSYFKEFLANFEVKIEILTSSTTKKQKANLIEKLKNKQADILIATHAVLEDDVLFGDLGLVVIDEQHRFGVIQRLKLVSKGQNVDTLLMSATPIPRSLMMSLYGDMDITILNEKPKNRQPIQTSVMSQAKSAEIYQAIKRNIEEGQKIYWICPAIDQQEVKENEDIFGKEAEAENELENVINKYNELSKIINPKYLATIHGKLKDKEKEQIMQDFANPNGNSKLLIATTVIEVGIDVPDATIIIIENAEMFGLAQLHQIRGRVGRSDKKSFCILLYGKKLGQNGVRRLYTLKNSNDGFYIAEQDLKMRGSGDLIGTRQSGLPNFKIADLEENYDLVATAHQNAENILKDDSNLESSKNAKYRYLIKLFGYDACLNLVKSG